MLAKLLLVYNYFSFNSLNPGHEIQQGDSNFMVVVNYNGTIKWVPRVVERSPCNLQASDFPFDEQRCILKYGSWNYPAGELQIVSTRRSMRFWFAYCLIFRRKLMNFLQT